MDQQIIIAGIVLVTAERIKVVNKKTKINSQGFPRINFLVINHMAIKWLTPDCSTIAAIIVIKKISSNVLLPQPSAKAAFKSIMSSKINPSNPITLGQSKPIVDQAKSNAQNTPSTFMPNAVSGSTAGRYPNPNIIIKNIATFP